MSFLRFPFNWGAVPDVVPAPPPPSPRWATLSATAKGWIEGAPVAAQHRFERVFEQPRTVFGQSINFAFHIQSQFPFKVATGTNVKIASTITNP